MQNIKGDQIHLLRVQAKLKQDTNPYHFVHNVMNCCFYDQDLLPSFCITHIFSLLLVTCHRLHKLKKKITVLIPSNSTTLSRALADPLLRRRNVLFLPT